MDKYAIITKCVLTLCGLSWRMLTADFISRGYKIVMGIVTKVTRR